VLYVTHDQEEAITMSDRVALMNRGRIAQLGSAEDLYERPATRFVAEFIGESNLIEGRVETSDGGTALVLADGARLALPNGASPAPRSGACTLMVRPEKIMLGAAGHGETGLDGTVEEVIYVGEFTRYRVRVMPAVVINAKVSNTHAASRAKAGDSVRLWWAA